MAKNAIGTPMRNIQPFSSAIHLLRPSSILVAAGSSSPISAKMASNFGTTTISKAETMPSENVMTAMG